MSQEPQSRPNGGRHLPPIETRFKKGVSGNPGGKSKKKPLTAELERLASDPAQAKLAAAALVTRAKRGDVHAFREFADRVEGKVEQPVAVTQTGAPEDAELPALLLELVQLYLGHKRV